MGQETHPTENISRLLRRVPDQAVDLLVERRTSRRELPQLVVLRTHEGRAVAERSANPLPLELAVLLNLAGEVRLRQGRPADADDRGPPLGEIGRRYVGQELLQIA